MRPLLQCKSTWNSYLQRLSSNLVEKCEHCIASSPPMLDRNVSIADINLGLKDVVYVDLFHSYALRRFHAMDSYSRFSAALPVLYAPLSDYISAF